MTNGLEKIVFDETKITDRAIVSQECWSKYPLKQRIWSYAQMVSNRTYTIHESDLEAYRQFIEDYEAGKCLVLVGQPGSGKSTLTKILSKVTYPLKHKDRFKFVTAGTISDNFSKHGYDSLKQYCCGNWVFDDVGIEEKTRKGDFGAFVEVFEKLIYDICESHVKGRCRFIISTNLSFKETPEEKSQFEKRYGSRVMSRVNQLCSIIKINGQDYRKTMQPILIYPEVIHPEPEEKGVPMPDHMKADFEKLRKKYADENKRESGQRDFRIQVSDYFESEWVKQGKRVNKDQERLIVYDEKEYTRHEFFEFCNIQFLKG